MAEHPTSQSPISVGTRVYIVGVFFAFVVAEEIKRTLREVRYLEYRVERLEKPNLLRELGRTRCVPAREAARHRAPLSAVPAPVDVDERQAEETPA